MNQPEPTTTNTTNTTTAPGRQPRRWPWITGIAGAGIVGIIIGAASAGTTEPAQTIPDTESRVVTVDANEEQQAALDQRTADLDDRELALDAFESELEAREEAVTGAEAEQAANTVGDGIWTVGVDIEPGTYRATDVSDDCYWAVLVSGTNGSDIVDNGIPGGGNPTVTVREGQDFESSGCGDWTRQ